MHALIKYGLCASLCWLYMPYMQSYALVWRYTDLDTGISSILVKATQHPEKDRPSYSFTKKTQSPPRHFNASWSCPETGDTVYLIKKITAHKPHFEKSHLFKWVDIEAIRHHPHIQKDNATDLCVQAADGSSIYIDKNLVYALTKKRYKDS